MTGSYSMFDDPQFQRPERMRAYTPVYYTTRRWRTLADHRKWMDGYRCQNYRCPRRGIVKVQAHHVDREHQGDELPSDLISLCRDCHEEWERLGLVA